MMPEETVKFCTQCILSDKDPEIEIDENGLCNLCNIKTGKQNMFHTYKQTMKSLMEFESKTQRNKGGDNYDCLLMLSGGKDSIYMLNKLVKKDGLRPLAFTFNHPFESKHALNNIEKVVDKLRVDHITFTPDTTAYKKLMRHVFIQKKDEMNVKMVKLPCLTCTNIMKTYAFMFAYRMRIPYFLYCADPIQITAMETNIRDTVQKLLDILGKELLCELIPKNLIDAVIYGDLNNLPKIIYPYVAMADNYNKDNIVTELKNAGLYETSPRETHCSLYTLLNHYSYRHYDSYYYAQETSQNVRLGIATKEEAKKHIENYRDIVLNIATKKTISEEDKLYIKEILSGIYIDNDMKSQADYEFNNIILLRKIAEELDIDIDSL